MHSRPLKFFFYALAIVSLAGFAGAPAAAYFEVLPAQQSFLIFLAACALGVFVAVVCIVVAARKGPETVSALIFMGLIPTAFVAYTVSTSYEYPLIHDVSTERNDPPKFMLAAKIPENAKSDMNFPRENKAIIEEHYPDIQSLGLTKDAYAVFNRAMDLAREQEGWTITSPTVSVEGESTVYMFEGYAVSRFFRFHDDFVVRVRELESGCVVDMRSRSRLGKGDLGANANRIRDFLTKLNV